MSEDHEEKRIYEHNDPALYAKLSGMMTASLSNVEIDGQAYQAAQDKDEDGTPYFIIVPAR